MLRKPTPRMLVLGSAVGFFLLEIWSGLANACVIFVRSPVAVGAVVGQCTADAAEEDVMRGRDPKALSGDNLAASDPSRLVLWSLFGDRLEVLPVNINAGRRNPSTVESISPDVLDMATIRSDPGPGPLHTQHTGADLSGDTRPASDRGGLADDVLWQAVKSVAQYYDIMNPDGDFAAVIRVGAEAIHSISLEIDAVAAATGLGAANRYQSVSLEGDAAETGLLGSKARRAAPEVGSAAYYLAALQRFVFSRDGLIAGLIIMVVYIAISGLYSLLRALR